MYCWEDCRSSDAHSHKIECSLVPTLLAWDMGEISFLLVKILTKTGITKIMEFLGNPPALNADPLSKGFIDGQYTSNFNSIYHLKCNSELRSPSDIFKRATTAWCLVKCMGQLLPDPDAFGSLFLRLLQSLAVNSNAMSENYKDLSGKEQEYGVGGAVLPTVSLLTHSCNPNLSQVCNGNFEIVHAVQPIKKGSVLETSYGWKFMHFSKPHRQERCWSRHQFKCKCIACEENWPLLGSQWPMLPVKYRNERARRLCESSVKNVRDLWESVMQDKEISSKDAARISKHIKIMSSAGNTKCFNYYAHVDALDHFFARKSCRYVQKYP